MKSKQAEVEKGDDADITNILDSPSRAAGMAGPWSRRSRWLAALGLLLVYLLLLSHIRSQYQQMQRLNRLLDLEKHTDELLKNLQMMDHHLQAKLERLEALHHP